MLQSDNLAIALKQEEESLLWKTRRDSWSTSWTKSGLGRVCEAGLAGIMALEAEALLFFELKEGEARYKGELEKPLTLELP